MIAPHPIRLDVANPLAVPRAQKLDCEHRSRCLDLAARWPAFSCASCDAYQPAPPAERPVRRTDRTIP